MNIKDKGLRDEIVAQSLQEIVFDRRYKQGKITNWQKNENQYYSKKIAVEESRANVDLARMQEFVHTLQSKIKDPLVFKFLKRKEAQLKRVKRLNALRELDSSTGFWNMKDLVGKKQAIIYGRAIYSYFADSVDGYKSHLGNVDVYDFLIDPSAGGIDIDCADHLGDYGVVLKRKDLELGVKGKQPEYMKDAVEMILTGDGNNTEMPQEETNKLNRTYGQNTTTRKELQNKDKFKFWRWFTTFEGERYYLLLQERAGAAIRVEPMCDLFPKTKTFPLGAWPYWSWAAFPDLTEFWTPSFSDYVREMFMAQNVSINQMLDNAEQVNKPMKIVNTGAIEDMAKLKYRRDNIIPTKGDYDASKAVQVIQTPSIDTPILVFNTLEKIQEKASGVLAQAKGISQEDGTLGIYEGNQQQAADRYGLLNISYAFGYERFAKLYELGVRDNLTKAVAIDMLGPDGIETEKITRKDIFKKDDDFSTKVEASNAETQASTKTQEMKLKFLSDELTSQNQQGAPKIINPKKAFEIKAKIAGFSEDDIKELLDMSDYGNAELMSECARDIESLLEGEDIRPNSAANNAYKQKFVDWLTDHQEDMVDKPEIAKKMFEYLRSLDEIITNNENRMLNTHEVNMLNNAQPGTQVPGGAPQPGGAPVPDGAAPQPGQPDPSAEPAPAPVINQGQ